MRRFSANLGFLWTDRPLPDAIHAAHAAGFDAVECHWPFATPAEDVRRALDATGLSMLGLNAPRGDTDRGENGLAALPGREAEARATIVQALDYATAIGATNVHVMAGVADGGAVEATFMENLIYATGEAEVRGLTILIEPMNRFDAPGYLLRTTDQARAILEAVGAANLKIMFDCYHIARTEGDPLPRLSALAPKIGHIQFAGVPDRGPPDTGTLDYAQVFAHLDALGWTGPLGAEYRPDGPTGATLGWMGALRDAAPQRSGNSPA